MQAYTSAETCLQRYILQYFGDEGEDCKKCSNCLDERELLDITIDAQKVLSCVVRMGERFGKTAVAQVLIGSKNKNIAKWNFESLSTLSLIHISEPTRLLSISYAVFCQTLQDLSLIHI